MSANAKINLKVLNHFIFIVNIFININSYVYFLFQLINSEFIPNYIISQLQNITKYLKKFIKKYKITSALKPILSKPT